MLEAAFGEGSPLGLGGVPTGEEVKRTRDTMRSELWA